ncbi:microsomal signal peptidase 25 kDa subunit-domain-containing protein [Kockovaella imperatae]|uniref:Signal peptidase complex subunit 2 n=1 Tax=Kockovaella imperatae TaxID=4999 RepID=A0A1Y1UM65_9TREE|nr:microsomal signal peptidase 25 kDa subunit-domain-containing protein [Kockovaella imperatae]ORX38225.1 microsomal signal peptidase 25 kDa subunit-domain-containing protein [Kockovaella imperatae]
MSGKKNKGKGIMADGQHGQDGLADLKMDSSVDILASDPLPTVHVSKSNLGEMKNALDDAVKKHLTGMSFTPSIFNPTVHLSLGYTSVLLCLGSVLYSLRVEFEDSKPALWVGVVGYFTFQSILWAWKRWVERGEIFRGRRRRIVKRIETDHIQITTSTNFNAPQVPSITFSPHTRPSSPSLAPSSPISSPGSSPNNSSTLPPKSTTDSQQTFTPSSIPSSVGKTDCGPTYSVQLTLSTTSNSGKSLLRKSRVVAGRGVGEFIDTHGGIEEGEIGRWLNGLLIDAGLVGAEETEGLKEE